MLDLARMANNCLVYASFIVSWSCLRVTTGMVLIVVDGGIVAVALRSGGFAFTVDFALTDKFNSRGLNRND